MSVGCARGYLMPGTRNWRCGFGFGSDGVASVTLVTLAYVVQLGPAN